MDDSIAVNKPTASGDRVAHAISASAVRFYTPLAFALSLLILVLRYPTSLFAAEPLWEDGPIFYLKGFDGLSSLAQSYQGYLHLGARMVAIVAAAIPPALAPLLMNSVTILVTAGVATFIASDRLRSACPDRRLRLALAIGFVLMPAAQDLSWHLVYLQWSLAFFLLIRVLADEPGPRWVWPDRAAVAIAALTGPFSILFAPLYLWRRRRLGVTAWIVVACAVVQLFVVITAYRGPAGQTTPLEAVAVLATRLFVEPLLGYRVTWILSGAGHPADRRCGVRGRWSSACWSSRRRSSPGARWRSSSTRRWSSPWPACSGRPTRRRACWPAGVAVATSCSAPRRSSPSSSRR